MSRILIAAIVVLAIAMAGGRGSVAAQQAPSITSAAITPSTATIGDHLTMTVTVAHDQSLTIDGPGFGDNFGDFELLDVPAPLIEQSGADSTTTLTYTLATFKVGRILLPPLVIHWRGSGGDGTLSTEPQPVDINSVLLPNETNLRPLKPQLEIRSQAPSAVWPTLFVAIFAALTVLGYALVRQAIGKPTDAALPATELPLSAREHARHTLDILASEDPRREAQAFYAAIAFAMRRYLTEQFDFPAFAMTRRELQRHSSRAGIDRWPARLVANLLEQCDAVQFAGFRPPNERMEADLTAAYEIIELTSAPAPDADPAIAQPAP